MPARPTAVARSSAAARSLSLLAHAVAVSFCVLSLTGCLSGCFSSNPDALKESTADATAAAKRATGQIAQGVVQGLFRKGPLDVNTATAAELARLPGMTPPLARAIIAGRPYAKPQELVSDHILTRAQFNRIKAQLKSSPPASPTRP